jgi:hypothetical protein
VLLFKRSFVLLLCSLLSMQKPWQPAAAQAVRRWPVLLRLQQFVRGWRAHVTPEEKQRAARMLPEAALALFRQMPVDAQRHSLNVLQTLESAGWSHADLAIAALLHDAGKIAAAQAGFPLNLWWRGPLVLLETFLPGVFRRLCSPDPAKGWRYVLFVHHEHPKIGADRASAAGCSALACWLIAHHQDKVAEDAPAEHQELLRALRWADNMN